MEDGLLSLKWNNHKSTFFHILSNLRKKETYTDATLACDGKFFPVHKLVMSTCSDYFSEVFERTTCKSPVVILKDIRHHDLEALLDYMYLGEVDVKQSELAALIKAAECLRIKGLAVPDEDPTLSHKKTTHVPESRASPSGKRSRRESGEAESNHHFTSHHKVRRSLSPPSTSSSRSHSSLAPTSVPSQSGISDAQPQVPSHGMPPPVYSDSRSSMPDFSSNDAQKHQDQSLVPVDMIKVEVEEGSSNPPLRQRDSLPEQGERRKNSLTEGAIGTDSGGGSGGREKEPISNNFSEYTNHPTEIEKEEHDQLDTYNGSEQVPGPSGVQGGSQMMNWGEEEGNFPHNLFGGEDSSHQQVGRMEAAVEVVLEVADEGSSSSTSTRHFLDQDDLVKQYHPPLHHSSLHFESHATVEPNYNGGGFIRGARRSRRGSQFYACPYCKKQFLDKSKWSRHLLAHTGEKPFLCNVCSRGFSRKDNLQTHLKDKHRIFTKVIC